MDKDRDMKMRKERRKEERRERREKGRGREGTRAWDMESQALRLTFSWYFAVTVSAVVGAITYTRVSPLASRNPSSAEHSVDSSK